MTRHRGRAWMRWTLSGATLLLALLYAASADGRLSIWKPTTGPDAYLYAGRFILSKGLVFDPWVIGSPGLRFDFDWRFATGMGRWRVAVPLWVGLIPLAIATARAWSRVPPPRSACPGCEYDRRGLPQDAPCPECSHTPAKP
jgi:hypothetical protein